MRLSMRQRVTDDAGERHPLSHHVWTSSESYLDSSRRIVIDRGQDASRLQHGEIVGLVAALFIGVMVLVMVIGLSGWVRQFSPAAFAVGFQMWLAGVVLGGMIVTQLIKVRRADRHAGLFLRNALCPTCAYDPAPTVDREATLTSCPECGSSWRSDRIPIEEPARGKPVPRDSVRDMVAPRRRTSLNSLRDEGGRSMTMLVPFPLGRPSTSDDPAEPERRRAAQRRLRRGNLAMRLLLLVVCLLILFTQFSPFMAFAGSGGSIGSVLSRVFRVVVWLGLAYYLTRQIWTSSVGLSARYVLQVMLSAKLCPSCSRDLADRLSGEAEQTVDCPECGGRWHVPKAIDWS